MEWQKKFAEIQKLHLDDELEEDKRITEENERYWDLAGDIAAELINSDDTELGGIYDQLQMGIYKAFLELEIQKK